MTALSADLPLVNKRILLAVTGSIAACKAHTIIRELLDRGASVQVLLTEDGSRFFPPDTAGALSDFPLVTDQFEATEPGEMVHIDVKRETDCVLVAPATANRLLDLEQADASDALGTILRAFDGPTLYAPAMNPDMWTDARVQSIIREHSQQIIHPESGVMACGDEGLGRLVEPDYIAERVVSELWPTPISDQRWIVSGGPTREAWDDIRYLTNRSSGRMGEALARVGGWMGAEIDLVSGSQRQFYPDSMYSRTDVETTLDLLERVQSTIDDATGYISAAAVSDYKPSQIDGKIKSNQDDLQIQLEPNPDVLSELRSKSSDTILVGFSADESDDPSEALEKAVDKELDAIVFNSINQSDGGFNSENNTTVFCVPPETTRPLGRRTKMDTALQVWIGIINDLL